MGNSASLPLLQNGAAAADEPEWLRGEDELQVFLEANGVGTAALGKGSAKSLTNLLYELRSQACFLELQMPEAEQSNASGRQQPRVLRIVEPVFIRLCWRTHVLVQEEQRLTDGRMRTRRMLLAEKKEPCDGGGLFATIVRALHEELGLEVEKLQKEGALVYRADAYHFELEQIDSPSYPGLTSMYRTHHVMVDIPDDSLDLFRQCGLPECRDFVTLETTELGTTTHYWRWYDTTEALRQSVVKFPPQVISSNTLLPDAAAGAGGGGGAKEAPSWRTLSKEELKAEEQLAKLLEKAGIDPACYGTGKAKTIASLLKEVQKGESSLEWHEQQASVRRIAEPVFIQFRWRDRVLVEVEQRFDDGRSRKRNMLIAEKKSPEDADVCETALRGLIEELDLPKDFPPLDSVVHFMQEAYCCVAENLESGSYPGLPCVYVTHYCTVQITDAGVPHFERLGLLCDVFETSEKDKVNVWRWTPADEARKSKVKGFPELKEQKSSGEQAAFAYAPLADVPLDAASLKVLLEVGGVNVSAWGEYAPASLRSLAGELETGVAHLERDSNTGKIRRVLRSNLVQLMVEEGDGGMLSDSLRNAGDASQTGGTSSMEAAAAGAVAFGMEEARGLVHFRSDLACFEVVHADTASYPGLPCCHQTRLVQFDQRNAGVPAKATPPPAVTTTDAATFKSEQSKASSAKSGLAAASNYGSTATNASEASAAARTGQEPGSYPRLLDDVFTAERRGSEGDASKLSLPLGTQSTRRDSMSRSGRFRSISILSRDDGYPMDQGRSSISPGSMAASSPASRISQSSDEPCTPKRRSLYRQLRSLNRHLRFRMVANEAQQEKSPPAEHAVTCSCDIQLIRNINPLNATFHCRFAVFLEWLDAKAVGMPVGEVSPDKCKELSIPEIALQNTLATNLEIHSPPMVVNPETGHVACKVLFQALMQMELNMRLFPFDEQRLVLVLGLRARRDRNRAIFCQFCNVDHQIRLDEWRLTSSFLHADRPDGRARVQFGVVISRAYWYYLVNVLGTLVGIASMSFVGFLLHRNPPFDRLRFGVAVLFAQTTFRLSIENKLPKVSYSTAFDKYAIFCQLLVLTIMVGNAVSSLVRPELGRFIDRIQACALGGVWIFGNLGFVICVRRKRRSQHQVLEQLADQDSSAAAVPDASQEAKQELETLKDGLHYRGTGRVSVNPGELQTSVRAVSVATRIWLLHDIDPVSATFECKFTVYLEWLDEAAIGLPEGQALAAEQLATLDPPEVDVHNKVELTVEEGPHAYVMNSAEGQIMLCYTYHARLQIHLNLRRFPFDCQRLPINLLMPNQKDQDRAFVYRSCHLAQTARSLDEWYVDGLKNSTDYTEGLAQAMLEVCIRRRSGYYVVSVLSVLLGISSVMFTVFAIDVKADGEGFTDQGKILVPLLMTLLAFKLLIASGKIPKAAYATIFDRIMLACEALFFLTTLICSTTLLLALGSSTAESTTSFMTHAALVLLTGWVLYGVLIAVEVRCGREGNSNLGGQTPRLRISPAFEQQRKSLTSQPLLSGLNGASTPTTSKGVLLRIQVKQVHSVNATTGAFTCDFVASLAWLTDGATEMMEGEALGVEKLRELHLPALRVQNALTCKTTVLPGVVVNPESGHVACQVHVRAQVQLRFQLEDFPFDRQSLAIVLSLPEPRDLHRHLVLDSCENEDAVKISEWSVLGTFAGAGRHDGIAQAVFGVTIRRYSRYYVTSLKSLCLWSIFVFTMYTIDFQEYRNRGKILVGVLLVSIVGKLAVSSKLPRIARLTSYDRVALNSLALLFAVGCSTAFWCLVRKFRIPGLSVWTIARMDQVCGIIIFLVWAYCNMRVVCRMRQALSGAKKQAPDEVPAEFWAATVEGEEIGRWDLPSADVAKELEVLRQPEKVFAELGETTASPREVRRHNKTAPPCQADLGIAVGIKIWMVCNVDASTATFECKFHVFLEWCSMAAVGMAESTRISVRGDLTEADAANVERPRLAVKGAIAVLLEDYSDVEIRNSETGLVSCRVQYHVRMHHRFNLRSFPFDCQRLEVELELQNCRDRFLLSEFCDADDQKTHLDGWRLAALSTAHDDSIPRQVRILMLVERESGYYVRHVIAIFFFLTTLLFSFFLMRPHEFVKRLVDVLKIVLTQTTFRFSVEHRLPKVQHWTPFDFYVIGCQALCCLIVVCFIYSALSARDKSKACAVQQSEHYILACLMGLWLLWNGICALQARRVRRRELRIGAPDSTAVAALKPRNSTGSMESRSLDPKEPVVTKPSSRTSVSSSMTLGGGVRPWELDALSSGNMGDLAPQVVSVAFRIWLVRNVDLVTATFECKFRVFLEWLDEDAKGLPKGKKAKLPVPDIAITNSVQSQVLDKSSAPEVVNSDTGHLAVQILYRATLRIDQEVHQFPFDCQWLAITLSLRDEGAERSRSFMFQYCEVDNQLQLDEWTVHPKPGFSTLTKHDAPSIQDTVMCGILIRRCCRYYVVNIMGMLCLISSLVFAIYTIDTKDFWARAEVFLGVFPLTVIFKMSAQGKLPRVGYSTKFDLYASSCQILFLAIVVGCMIASMTINLPKWLATCNGPEYDEAVVEIVGRVETFFALGLLLLWLAWNTYFTFQAWRQTRLPPLVALKSNVPIKLQDNELLRQSSKSDPDVIGLAPRLSVLAVKEKDREDQIDKANSQNEGEKPVVVV